MQRLYPGTPSVDPGGDLQLHVSSQTPQFRIDFFRQGADLIHVGETSFDGGAPYSVGPHDVDWGWPAFTFRIPDDWASGVYLALCTELTDLAVDRSIESPANHFAQALFVVRSGSPGANACMLYKVPLFTYHAYNELGDPPASLYTGGGTKVTMQRPGGGAGADPWDHIISDAYDLASFRQTFAHWDQKFIQWLEANNYSIDYCADLDIHQNADGFLSNYRLLLSVGHDEYWSEELRDNVENFIAAGGNVAFFSGNVCWWRVHLTDDDTAFTCDKSVHSGLSGPFDQWWTGQNNRPENALTGVSYRNAGGQWDGRRQPVGYTAQHSDHWVYQDVARDSGGSIQDGDVFGDGEDDTVVGYEADGAELAPSVNGQPLVPTTADGTPSSFVVLGFAQTSTWEDALGARTATMGVYTNGGIVFTAATTDWARVLARGNSQVTQITRNVLDRLPSRSVRIYGLGGPCSTHPAVEGAAARFHVDLSGITIRSDLTYQWSASAGLAGATDQPVFDLQLPSPPVPVTVTVTVDDGADCPIFGTLTFDVMSYEESALASLICALRNLVGTTARPRGLVESAREGDRFFVDPLWDPIRGYVGPVLNRQQLALIVRDARAISEMADRIATLQRRER